MYNKSHGISEQKLSHFPSPSIFIYSYRPTGDPDPGCFSWPRPGPGPGKLAYKDRGFSRGLHLCNSPEKNIRFVKCVNFTVRTRYTRKKKYDEGEKRRETQRRDGMRWRDALIRLKNFYIKKCPPSPLFVALCVQPRPRQNYNPGRSIFTVLGPCSFTLAFTSLTMLFI